VAQQITSRPGLFIAGYTALALALGALVIALRGYDFLLFILIWPIILSAMLVPWRMYLILIGIGVTVTAITLPLVVPDLNRSATTAAAATMAAFLICESVYRVMSCAASAQWRAHCRRAKSDFAARSSALLRRWQ